MSQASRANRGDDALPIAASRGSVTSFPGHRCGEASRWRRSPLPLAGNRDVFVAAGMAAVRGGLWNRAGDFVRVDPPIRCGLGEIARLAIEPGRMGAALVAVGEAFIDTIATGLVGDDEDPAVGRGRRCRRDESTGQYCGYESHAAPKTNERIARIG